MLVALLVLLVCALSRAQSYPNLPDAFAGYFTGAGFYKDLLPAMHVNVIRGFAYGMDPNWEFGHLVDLFFHQASRPTPQLYFACASQPGKTALRPSLCGAVFQPRTGIMVFSWSMTLAEV
jgi:hypothetical protein